VLTAVISDLHLGTRAVNDVLRSHAVRAKLMPLLAGVDQMVLLGDVLELRQGRLEDALEIARPFFGELGEILGDARVVLVPGNHDHALLGERVHDQFERPLSARDPGPLGQIAAWMPQAELLLSYPGFRPRPDVYATHGHYLDCHNTVPTVETILAAISRRRERFPVSGPLTVADYERVLAPLYELSFRSAQSVSGALTLLRGAPSKRLWESIASHDGRPALAGRLLGNVVIPAGVATFNRLGIGPFKPEVSGPVLRESGLRAISESLARRGIEAEHVVFGHTHRPGPLEGDEGWITPSGIRLHNCGNWVYESSFVGLSPAGSPYWPGAMILIEDDKPPRIERPLTDLRHEDFAPILEPASRVLWPDPRGGEPTPPQ
jgi:predicted phosphodiesterase